MSGTPFTCYIRVIPVLLSLTPAHVHMVQAAVRLHELLCGTKFPEQREPVVITRCITSTRCVSTA